jgi:mannose-6-phosphate isomerase
MEILTNPIRRYAWGSHTSIASLQGRDAPTDEPEAELWMGAHPDSPSLLCRTDGAVSLGSVVAADPVSILGEPSLARFGPRLPFMLKVLAAQESLSLQAHPDAAQAEAGYAAQTRASAAFSTGGSWNGGPPAYSDPYPKPELLVALTDFDALCGFRRPEASADAIEQLNVMALESVVDQLRSNAPAQALRGAMETLLRWPDGTRASVVAEVAASASRVRGLAYVADLTSRYPADMGVVVTLLLNHVSLAPDDAIWMPAGNLHAYLQGTGLEVLGSSDNVLRGGLTLKPANVDELLRVLRYEVLAEPLVKPVSLGPGVTSWPAPAPEFKLLRIDACADVTELEIDGPRIVFVASGRATVSDGPTQLTLSSGQAAFGPAGRALRTHGDGVVFVATTGL